MAKVQKVSWLLFLGKSVKSGWRRCAARPKKVVRLNGCEHDCTKCGIPDTGRYLDLGGLSAVLNMPLPRATYYRESGELGGGSIIVGNLTVR